jgi:hypothetical protein
MSVSCECCVMSGLCDELVPRPEESYRLWRVSNVCDHETSTKRGGSGPYKAVEPYKKKVFTCKNYRLIIKIIVTQEKWSENKFTSRVL